MDTYIKLQGDFKTQIEKDVILPSIREDIKDLSVWRTRWRRLGNTSENLAKLTSGAATILAFASGSYDDKRLSFLAGSLGTFSLILLQYAKYAHSESKERDAQLNAYMRSFEMPEVVQLPIADEEKDTIHPTKQGD